jgi:hypothetical protein
LSLPWSVGIALVLGELLYQIASLRFDGVLLAGMAWLVVWLTSVTLIWRETAAERRARLRALGIGTVHCPDCGYNMTGLKQARCPECGAEFTVDELFASLANPGDDLGKSR